MTPGLWRALSIAVTVVVLLVAYRVVLHLIERLVAAVSQRHPDALRSRTLGSLLTNLLLARHRTAREVDSHSTGTPEWSNPRGFDKDVFTFARVIFKSGVDPWRNLILGWWVDYPDADLNFSYRLQQMTSMRVDPDCRVLKLTDPSLRDYPMIYMEHPGYMRLKEPEVVKLDMSLVRGLHEHPTRLRLVDSMASVCRELGMKVVTEGVETTLERDALVSLGCDLAQGYYFARPAAGYPEPKFG